jgi:hypothetical protein
MPVYGHVECYLDGILVYETPNTILNNLYSRGAQWLASNTPNGGTAIKPPGFIAVGTGAGTPSVGDATMFFENLRNIITSASIQSTYTSRLVAVFTGTQANVTITEIGLFDTAGDNGTASAGGASTLTDGTKSWTTNQWTNWTVYITGGTGIGQSRIISSNTSTVLTVSVAWTTQPDATSTYTIGGVGTGNFMFAHTNVNVTKVSGTTLNVIWSLTWPSF